MELLVTGGAGYIGSHTAHQLVDAGHSVTVLDNLSSGHRWAVPTRATFVEGSTGDREVLRQLFAKKKFDAVLHFAAFIDVGESVREPAKYYANNLANSLTLFEEMIRARIPRVIFSSTAAVYAENATDRMLQENDPLQPISPYGASKAMAERVLMDLASAHPEFRFIILRYFNVAGARSDLKIGQANPKATHLVKSALETVFGRRSSLIVYGSDYPTPDGTCRRDYVHVEDIASAHLAGLTYLQAGGLSDIFNVGYGRPISVLEVIEAVKRVTKRDIKIEFGSRRAGDPVSVAADSGKIRSRLNWRPKYDNLDEICRTAYEWEKRLSAGEIQLGV